MNSCKNINSKLIFFVEKSLPRDEMQQVEEHLHSCKECKQSCDILKASFQLIDAEKDIVVNPFLHTRIIQKLEDKKSYSIFSLKRVLQPVLVSALLVVGISFGVGLGHVTTKTNNDTLVSNSSNELFFNDLAQEPIENFLLNYNE
jgi:hypothetical protein